MQRALTEAVDAYRIFKRVSIEYLPRILRYLYLGVSNFQLLQVRAMMGKIIKYPNNHSKYMTTMRTCGNIKYQPKSIQTRDQSRIAKHRLIGDIPNTYPLYKAHGLIIKDTIPRVPAFFL